MPVSEGNGMGRMGMLLGMLICIAGMIGSFAAYSIEKVGDSPSEGNSTVSSAPMGHFSLTNNGDVYDAETNLEWRPLTDGMLTFAEASKKCAAQGERWQLPTAGAVKSLYKPQEGLHARCGNYTCQVHPLLKLTRPNVWVNQIADHNKNQAWVADLGTGRGYTTSKNSRYAIALCVRDRVL